MRALHHSAVLALAALCVLAGCGGLTGPEGDGSSTDRTNVTPAEIPRDLHGGTIAPGLTQDRLVNATALVEASRSAQQNESLTVVRNGTSVTQTSERNVTLVPYSSVTRVGATRQRGHRVIRFQEAWRNVSHQEMWIGPDRAVSMVVTNGTRGYLPVRPAIVNQLREVAVDARGLQGVDRVAVERAGTTEGGSARYRVRAVDPSLPDQSVGARELFETRNVSLVMTVDERGTIHSYRFGYEFRVDGEWRHYWTAYELRAVGETTVERPDWYDEAVAATQNRTTAR